MNQTQPLQSPARQPHTGVNPFARALAEAERTSYAQRTHSDAVPTNGQDTFMPAGEPSSQEPAFSPDMLKMQQEEAARLQRLEVMRKRLHEQINPVDTTALFDAREREVKKQIDSLRAELKMLVKDVAHFEKEVEVTLMTQIVEPGQKGSYFITFFSKLRMFIMFLRQKIKSARTWLNTSKGKARKKGKKPGLVIDGQSHEKTTTVQDMMHHERNNNYAGS